MNSRLPSLALALALSLSLPCPDAQAQDAPPKKDQVLDLGGVKINRTQKFLEVAGVVSLNRGLVELMACSPAGKRYESVLVLKCRADMFQTGLLFLGLKRGASGRFQGDKIKSKGSPVEMVVSWTDPKTKKTRRFLAEDLVWNHRTRKSMKRVGWSFVGSRFVKDARSQREVFMASVTGTLIVTYHDPDAILDTPHGAGTDDTTFYANHLLLPPRGTEILMRVYPKEIYDKLPAGKKAMPIPNMAGIDKDDKKPIEVPKDDKKRPIGPEKNPKDAPEQPKKDAPEQPRKDAPEQPKKDAPEQPKKDAPEQPKKDAPEQPKKGTKASASRTPDSSAQPAANGDPSDGRGDPQ